MTHRPWIALLLVASGCDVVSGCGAPEAPGPRAPPAPSEPAATAPAYELHEWGLVSAGPRAFEVAAGPGQRATPIAVDKPVLYVHPRTDEGFALRVEVALGAGLTVAEHFPPASSLAPIRWTARVGGQCRGRYPPADDSRCPDGYCELGELASYETPDAACLDVDGTRAPLLFYRLRGEGRPPALPVEVVASAGGRATIRNASLTGQVGALWRVTWDGAATRAARVELPALGESRELPSATGPVADARRALRADLATLGLTDPEAAVFARAWDAALFGDEAARDGDDGAPPRADGPVDRVAATDESGGPDDLLVSPGPRVSDALLYWLPARAIDDLARVTAEPAPAHLRRAFLVRQAL